jgi:hypothetical protein
MMMISSCSERETETERAFKLLGTMLHNGGPRERETERALTGTMVHRLHPLMKCIPIHRLQVFLINRGKVPTYKPCIRMERLPKLSHTEAPHNHCTPRTQPHPRVLPCLYCRSERGGTLMTTSGLGGAHLTSSSCMRL